MRLVKSVGDRLLNALVPQSKAAACYEIAYTCYSPPSGTYRVKYTEYYSPDCNYTYCCTWDPWGNFKGCVSGYCTVC